MTNPGSASYSPVIRKPAVAGSFYPSDPVLLRAEIERCLSAQSPGGSAPVMLISPHAGYIYSGQVAAAGFCAVDRLTHRVILVGHSHHLRFPGISIPEVDAFETPPGRVPLDKELLRTLRAHPLVTALAAAHSKEHCLEVQLPFLQVILESFSIVPIITGDVDPRQLARILLPLVAPGNLIIASSDLSHYLPHGKAQETDSRSLAAIAARDAGGFFDGCGEIAVRAVVDMASQLDLLPTVLDARTSFETAPEDYKTADRVVGYASVAFISRCPRPEQTRISEQTGRDLLNLARRALEAAVNNVALPPVDYDAYEIREPAGCFVTLKKEGELRGCIGYIETTKPAAQALVENARNAALNDPRFKPVSPSELDRIKIEISILTPPRPLAFSSPRDLLEKLVPRLDGVILQKGMLQSTFLPQVWDQLPDKVQFLQQLSLKGGMGRDGWKSATVKRYRAIHFVE